MASRKKEDGQEGHLKRFRKSQSYEEEEEQDTIEHYIKWLQVL